MFEPTSVLDAVEHFKSIARCRNLRALVVPTLSVRGEAVWNLFSGNDEIRKSLAGGEWGAGDVGKEWLLVVGCLSLNKAHEFEIDVDLMTPDGPVAMVKGLDVSSFWQTRTSGACTRVEWGVIHETQPLRITIRRLTPDPDCKLLLAVYGQTRSETERRDMVKAMAAEPVPSLKKQVEALAECIMRLPINEPSRNEGAIDTAIRLLDAAYATPSSEAVDLRRRLDNASEAYQDCEAERKRLARILAAINNKADDGWYWSDDDTLAALETFSSECLVHIHADALRDLLVSTQRLMAKEVLRWLGEAETGYERDSGRHDVVMMNRLREILLMSLAGGMAKIETRSVRPIRRMDRCPECDLVGELRGRETTCMGPVPHVDADGQEHVHDSNRVTNTFACQNGHQWSEPGIGDPCPACGHAWRVRENPE
jgi:hypothetical protein